jgi:hypothetical protein
MEGISPVLTVLAATWFWAAVVLPGSYRSVERTGIILGL